MSPETIASILNKSVVTYQFASTWEATDYRCVSIVMEFEAFVALEKLLGQPIEGRLGKQYEGINP